MEIKHQHKRGFLQKDFELFHLKDKKSLQFEVHFHDFNKIILFISGNVTYLIEGKAYKLKPGDILLVNSNEIHQPIINPMQMYERIILWVNPLFLKKFNTGCNLLTCFQIASQEKINVLRLVSEELSKLRNILIQLENALKDQEFGSQILKESLFLQFIIYLNRDYLGHKQTIQNTDIEFDETIDRILQYINQNLREDLSVDRLSALCHLSQYHLMRKFKQQTGYTLHNYIVKKRLISANSLLKEGKSVTEACLASGFSDYANFIRTFKKVYGLSPKKYYKMFTQYEG